MNTQAQLRVSHDRIPGPVQPRSNLPLLLIAAAFLCLTIGVVVYPLLTGSQTARFEAPPLPQAQETAPVPQELTVMDVEVDSPVPVVETAEPEPETVTQAARAPLTTTLQRTAPAIDLSKINANDVARPQFALFSNTFTPLDRVTSATIKQQLRQPIRLIDTGRVAQDIPSLTSELLTRMSLNGQPADPRLTDLVASAVFERQSDKYVRTLVNAVAEREPLTIPATLRTTSGDWDTYSLLKAMAKTAGGPIPAPAGDVETNGFQRIVPGDSLARIALRYYGDPLKFDIILAANPQIDPQNPVLRPGDTIQMPKP